MSKFGGTDWTIQSFAAVVVVVVEFPLFFWRRGLSWRTPICGRGGLERCDLTVAGMSLELEIKISPVEWLPSTEVAQRPVILLSPLTT